METQLGRELYNLCRSLIEIKTVVEIGTWDGRGTTECIIKGLTDSGKSDVSLMSFECNLNMLNQALGSWGNTLPNWAKLIHGRVIDSSELDRENLSSTEQQWIHEDSTWMSCCKNYINELPSQIDLLVLDGGEFSTKAEFLAMRDKSKIVVIDDTAARKCRWIREHVLSSPDKYEIMSDRPTERNGTMVFKSKG